MIFPKSNKLSPCLLGTQQSIFIYNTHEYQLEIPPQVYVIPAYQDISTPRFICSPRKQGDIFLGCYLISKE